MDALHGHTGFKKYLKSVYIKKSMENRPKQYLDKFEYHIGKQYDYNFNDSRPLYFKFKKTGPLNDKEKQYLEHMKTTEGEIFRDNDKILFFEWSYQMGEYIKIHKKFNDIGNTRHVDLEFLQSYTDD